MVDPKSKPNSPSGLGSVTDAIGPALDQLTAAAKTAAPESPGDPKVIAAVALGWLMKELTGGWPLNPLPPDLSLDPEQKCQAQALELTKLLDDLKLSGVDTAAVGTTTGALQRGPAPRAAERLERNLVVALAGSDPRFAEAYTLGGGLRNLIGGASPTSLMVDGRPAAQGARQVRRLVGVLDSLSSDLPSHAARGVANSLAEWWRFQAASDSALPDSDAASAPALVDAQVNLWRSVIVGEKKAIELLEPEDYLDAARQLEGRFAHRVLTSVWLWLLAAAALVLFGFGVWVLFGAKGHPGKVAAGASGVLAALGITWKGIGGTVGKLVGKLEAPIWGAELDTAVTVAITVTKPRKRKWTIRKQRSSAPPDGLSYDDRRRRFLSERTGSDRGGGESLGTVRRAGSLPFPDRPAGTVDDAMPFDHLVVVMMENHSFDNLLGALSRSRKDVDGLTFDSAGRAMNSNPGAPDTSPVVPVFPLPNTAQATHVSQSWKATHEQIDGGAMDGFVRSVSATEPMGYYTPEVLPFAYSLGEAFTLANRWFCSVPGPTYPNRRFLLAGTAYGGTVTGIETLLDGPPPNGTIFDRLSDHHVSWGDYFTDVPSTIVIPTIVLKHLDHHHRIGKFFEDCAAGNLPAVSFVDPGVGALRSIVSQLPSLPPLIKDALRAIGVDLEHLPPGETEEDPQDMYYGEVWAHRVIEAVLRSPSWSRTLLIYTYDEHGGYYDHVPPPPAVEPDDIPPKLQPGDPPGAYNMYGVRVPAVVASPYAKPGGVTDVIHDHTSVLATIEHKWNLPALTDRDANAATVMDFLDVSHAALLEPPDIQGPSSTGPSGPVKSSG